MLRPKFVSNVLSHVRDPQGTRSPSPAGLAFAVHKCRHRRQDLGNRAEDLEAIETSVRESRVCDLQQ